jgi:formylglycine-generating enzyme required for sulfatase activity
MRVSIWRRLPFVLAALAGVLLAAAPAAYAERRVALVIGNGNYSKVAKLPNPARDASAIEKMLRGLGFETVELKRDLGRDAMRRALRAFSDKVRDADIAVVFFAGHGIEVNGTNYLIPVDAALERDIDVEDEAVPLDRVTQLLEPARRLRLVILDACRDNPFVHSMRRIAGTRSIGRGLAKVEVLTSDTLIAFAARAGSTAEDGKGANSPYTSALVKHLATPGLDVRLAFGRVRDEVLRSTKNQQEPFVYGSLGGTEISLVAGPGGSPPPVSPPSVAAGPAPVAPTPTPSATDETVRICRDVQGMTDQAQLMNMASQYKGTPAGDCIEARFAEHICREVVPRLAPGGLDWFWKQYKDTPAAACIAARRDTYKRDKEAVDAERFCAELETITDLAVLKSKVGKHKDYPGEEACIAPRIEAVEKQQLALAPLKASTPLTAAQERGLKPKDRFKECEACPEMMVVPTGQFTMGSPREEEGRNGRSEEPRQQVTFARPFAVGRFEVTFAEWDACVADGGCAHKPRAPWGRGNQPVSYVDWNHVTQQYLPWLSRKTGKTYRLLTEAEWEYVARAGTATPFWWGSSINGRQASYSAMDTDRRRTVPVDSYAANPWGLYNVHGNVWEWVQDCWNDTYYDGVPPDGSARSSGECEKRVLRGGCYQCNWQTLRSARREQAHISNESGGVGFRVGRTLER